jgi:hypothetical protein
MARRPTTGTADPRRPTQALAHIPGRPLMARRSRVLDSRDVMTRVYWTRRRGILAEYAAPS